MISRALGDQDDACPAPGAAEDAKRCRHRGASTPVARRVAYRPRVEGLENLDALLQPTGHPENKTASESPPRYSLQPLSGPASCDAALQHHSALAPACIQHGERLDQHECLWTMRCRWRWLVGRADGNGLPSTGFRPHRAITRRDRHRVIFRRRFSPTMPLIVPLATRGGYCGCGDGPEPLSMPSSSLADVRLALAPLRTTGLTFRRWRRGSAPIVVILRRAAWQPRRCRSQILRVEQFLRAGEPSHPCMAASGPVAVAEVLGRGPLKTSRRAAMRPMQRAGDAMADPSRRHCAGPGARRLRRSGIDGARPRPCSTR